MGGLTPSQIARLATLVSSVQSYLHVERR